MTGTASKVILRRVADAATVDAELCEPITPDHLASWKNDWLPVIAATKARLKAERALPSSYPESAHWDWNRKLGVLGSLLAYRTFAIMAEGELQGLMAIETVQHRTRLTDSRGRMGLGLSYVEFLEAAPWNRPEHVSAARFRGAGSVLIATAIQASLDDGFHGRMGLHSLPRSQAFYRDVIRMQDFGPDSEYPGNLHYFELNAEGAEAFLRGGP